MHESERFKLYLVFRISLDPVWVAIETLKRRNNVETRRGQAIIIFMTLLKSNSHALL